MSLADDYTKVKEETDTRIPAITEGDGYPVTMNDFELTKTRETKQPMLVLYFKITPFSKPEKTSLAKLKGKKTLKRYVMTNAHARKLLYAFIVAIGGVLEDMDNVEDIADFLDGLDSKPKGRMYYDKPEGEQYPTTHQLFGFEYNGKPVPEISEQESENNTDNGIIAPD